VKTSKIIATVGVVGALIVIVAMAVFSVRPYLNVSQVTQNAGSYNGQEIQVIGTVQSFDNGTSFTLVEGANTITVNTGDTTIPTGFQNSIRVVVAGIFYASSTTIDATQILTQCSD
jgi:cytochrome c-type biogenesis protein CcmE